MHERGAFAAGEETLPMAEHAFRKPERVAQPEDIAPVVAFRASDQAGWITGDTIHVDDGSKL
jgi:NAD(P)-dependent dehydrogenase (short-subunit alcohol dehydrogenase family)